MLHTKGLSLMALVMASLLPAALAAQQTSLANDWQRQHDRIWLGQSYWANPMEDWKLENGRIECTRGELGDDRSSLSYSGEGVAHLAAINVEGLENPALQVIGEANGEVIDTLRIGGASYRPKVLASGKFTVRAGDQDNGNMKTLKGLPAPSDEKIRVEFP